jgi:hypothetical protein
MKLWTIYHRYSTDYDANVPLRVPYPGDVAAQNIDRLLIVKDGKWVNATREEFDAALIQFKFKKKNAPATDRGFIR